MGMIDSKSPEGVVVAHIVIASKFFNFGFVQDLGNLENLENWLILAKVREDLE